MTVIGDSVLTAVAWQPEALAILTRGFDLRLEAAVCRTLTGTSCPFEGSRPPTLVTLVRELGTVAPTVVVEVGYSDDPLTFSRSVLSSLDVLEAAGAQRILWLNLREQRPHYARMNAMLAAVSASRPSVTIVDWNAYSQGRNGWFQSDGVHLTYSGAMGIAGLLHNRIERALAPRFSIATTRLPPASAGARYATRLTARGGVGRVTWQVVSGPLPRGLQLLANGSIRGTTRAAGTFERVFQAQDALGRRVTRTLTLRVARPGGSSAADARSAATR